MNTPPLLLGATLIFWGWQTGYIVVGFLLGALIEVPRLVKARWMFSQADFDRLWNLCAFIVLGAGLYLVINEGGLSFNDLLVDAGRRPEAIREKGRAALLWFQWFPMAFYPFAIAAAFSEQPLIEAATFSWFVRRRRNTPEIQALPRINVAYPYFAITLFAAAASNQRSVWYYIGTCALLGWALWSRRNRRFPAVAWATLFVAVVVSGYFSHQGLARLEKALDEMNVTFFSHFASLSADSRQSRTAMGMVGKLKLSDRIMLRLHTDGQPPPSLLREASYNVARPTSWHNASQRTNAGEFTRVLEDTNGTWLLLPHKESRRNVTIGCYVSRQERILSVPNGVSRLDRLPVENMERNTLGVVRVTTGSPVVEYDAHYDEGQSIDSPPGPLDTAPADPPDPAVTQVARELGLHRTTNALNAMAIIGGYFRSQFTYTSYLTQRHVATTNETAMARFLLRERSGHCEYFASATALLLRQAGIPARYAIGYSVQEGSGKKYVVRERHAHAWTLVWYDGAWHDFDTTPDSWVVAEGHSKSVFTPIKDFFSNVWFAFSKWRSGASEWRKYLVWVPVPLIAIALGTFFLKKQWRQIRKPRDNQQQRGWPGLDSEFYTVESALAARGLTRHEGESWSTWAARISGHAKEPALLSQLVRLHSKYRFDPDGLTAEEREALRTQARAYVILVKRG